MLAVQIVIAVEWYVASSNGDGRYAKKWIILKMFFDEKWFFWMGKWSSASQASIPFVLYPFPRSNSRTPSGVSACAKCKWRTLCSGTGIGVRLIDGYPECSVSTNRFLLLHLYPCTLLLLAFFYGISVLKIKRNFNEGRWITCATAFVIPIFVAWSIGRRDSIFHFVCLVANFSAHQGK